MTTKYKPVNRFLSLVLCLCMVLGLMPVAVFAADAVAAVTIGGVTTEYATLDEAIEAVMDCTEADNAVVKLLADIDLGDDGITINDCVLTFDLNGFEIKSTSYGKGALVVLGTDACVTIIDSGEDGKVVGGYSALEVCHGGTFVIDGGSFSADVVAVNAHSEGAAKINGGFFSASCAIKTGDNGFITVSGGTFDGDVWKDFDTGDIILALGKDGGDGAVFLDRMYLLDTTLGELLSNGAGYGRDGELLEYDPAGTSIHGGDVVVMPDHVHNWDTVVKEPTCTENGSTFYGCTICGYGEIIAETEALGHSFGDDKVCTICGGDAEIAINMTDSYGDGWDDNALEIYENDDLLDTATFDSGDSAQLTILWNPAKIYTFVWRSGNYADECGFEIEIAGEVVFEVESCLDFVDGETVFILCDHSYGEGVGKEVSCTEDGGIFYTCSKCGGVYIENKVSAPGHDKDENGICTVCGAASIQVTINMTDSYGDGWSGNKIAVFCGDKRIDTLTIEDGSEATWTCELDDRKDYDFVWNYGNYSDECSFQVLIDGEEVFARNDCEVYNTGDLVFSINGGEFVEGVASGSGDDDDNFFYVVAGSEDLCGTGWDPADFANEMTWSEEDGFFFKSYTNVPAGTYEFVVVTNGAWGNGEYNTDGLMEPGDPNVVVEVPEDGSIVFIGFNGEWVFVTVADSCLRHIDANEDCVCDICGESTLPPVYVGGVEMNAGDYLDLEGNISQTMPECGFAYYDGNTLTLKNYVYSGDGWMVEEFDGIFSNVLIYTENTSLELRLVGTNTLSNPNAEVFAYGIFMPHEFYEPLSLSSTTPEEGLVISGTGTLNIFGEEMNAIKADYIILNGGTVNIVAGAGITSSYGNSTMTVNGGELNITATASEFSSALRISHLTVNGGKIILSSDLGLGLDVGTLTVDGGYLEVKKGGMDAYYPNADEVVALGENVFITSPEGAVVGSELGDNDLIWHHIYNADGEIADAFVIEDPNFEAPECEHSDYDDSYVCLHCGAVGVQVMYLGGDMPSAQTFWCDMFTDLVIPAPEINNRLLYEIIAMSPIGAGIIGGALQDKGTEITISGSYLDGSKRLFVVVGDVCLGTVNLHGGSLIDEAKEQYSIFGLEITDTYHQAPFAVGGMIGGQIEFSVYTKEGCSLAGYKVNGTFYDVDDTFTVTEDGFVIDLIWECDGEHQWEDATCTEPMFCPVCGETYGNPTGHYDANNDGICDDCSENIYVKFQAKDDCTAVRLLTYVGDLADYNKVTFRVTINGKTTDLVCTKAYTSLLSNGTKMTPPSVFGEDAEYFVMYTLTGITEEMYETEMTVQVIWTAIDGTETVSEVRTVVIDSLFPA